MYNSEIHEIICQDKTVMMGFQGIRAADKLPDILQSGQSLIFNASDSNEPGTHWLCLYQNPACVLEMFDSCGNCPDTYNLKGKLPQYGAIIYNTKKLQGRNSSLCGVYCMYYLFYKCRGYPTSKIVDDPFTKDYDQNDRYLIDYIKRLYSNI
jgi:hypothetical protein